MASGSGHRIPAGRAARQVAAPRRRTRPFVWCTRRVRHGAPKCDDTDRDGICDASDVCPSTPGPRSDDPGRNGCPELDRDRDGILDREDACPLVPGVRTADPKTNGCPPPSKVAERADRDGDTVYDDEDACPDIAGIRTTDAKTNGCPPAHGERLRRRRSHRPRRRHPLRSRQPSRATRELSTSSPTSPSPPRQRGHPRDRTSKVTPIVDAAPTSTTSSLRVARRVGARDPPQERHQP
ncbi:MAG: thrombospondin type 3 repeat-containing protein [Polyangiaceae bacterium]